MVVCYYPVIPRVYQKYRIARGKWNTTNEMKIQFNTTRIFLIALTVLIVFCVLTFNVVYFSSYYGITQIDYINSLLLVPFILLIFSFGIFIEQNKQKEKLKRIDIWPWCRIGGTYPYLDIPMPTRLAIKQVRVSFPKLNLQNRLD